MDNHAPWGQPYKQETYPLWYPSDERMTNYPTNNMPSSSWNQLIFGTIDDMSIFESGLYQLVVALGIFPMVFLKKHKLHNLIKREIYILTTTTIKKHTYI